MTSLLELNAKIIYNELNLLANIICKPITISGHPIKIIGLDTYIISIPPPNPQLGIINTRFQNQTIISKTISDSQSDFDNIFKLKKENKINTKGNGIDTPSSDINKLVKKLRNLKKDVVNEKNNGDTLKSIYFKELITITAKSILKLNLHTQIKLPDSLLKTYAIAINDKCVYGDTNYSFYKLNNLAIFNVLKIINF